MESDSDSDSDIGSLSMEGLFGMSMDEILTGVLRRSVPPAPARPNPQSVHKKDSDRREAMQCQNCWKSKAESGVQLFRCSACRVEYYCSKKCQKESWSSHKVKCKINQATHNMNPTAHQKLRQIRAFTTKHRPSLRKAATRALEIDKDPDNSKEKVLMVYLIERESTLIEHSYYVTDAEVVTFEHFGPKADEMRQQMRMTHEQAKKTGLDVRAMFVVMSCLTDKLNNIVPIGYQLPIEPSDLSPGEDWKAWLSEQLNEGILK